MTAAGAYKKLLQIGKISGAVSFLLAAPYALVQYWQAQDASRVEQTLNFYKLYNGKPFTDYREKMTNELVKHKDDLNQAALSETSLLKVQSDLIQNDGVATELLLLFDFFDGVAVCVTAKVCDDETAIKLFKPRALDLYVNFYQYMMMQRASNPDFGLGLQAIAKSKLPKPISRRAEDVLLPKKNP